MNWGANAVRGWVRRITATRRTPGRAFSGASAWLIVASCLGSMAAVIVAVPFGSGFSAQLLYIPIVVASWTLGAMGAIASGLLAASGWTMLRHSGSEWALQSAMYLLFATACTLASEGKRSTRTAKIGRSQSGPEDAVTGRERVLESLARTVEVRDHHTQGHCQRVARNAVVLGKALDLDSSELDVLCWSALLHDLGKIAVPDYILLKSGPLSEEEFTEIRRHPGYGADLLTSVSTSFRPIADIVRAHHERWDGLGYPLGLKSKEIPLLARIIAVVDVFEALTSERPYRSPMPVPQALGYIAHGAGSQFDPTVVATFEVLVDKGHIECAIETSLAVFGDEPGHLRSLQLTP